MIRSARSISGCLLILSLLIHMNIKAPLSDAWPLAPSVIMSPPKDPDLIGPNRHPSIVMLSAAKDLPAAPGCHPVCFLRLSPLDCHAEHSEASVAMGRDASLRSA